MILAILMAAMLQQASDPVPANCVLDNSRAENCAVVFASENDSAGVGFYTTHGDIIVVGTSEGTTININMVTVGDATSAAWGQCRIIPRQIECRVFTRTVNFTIKANAK